MSKAKVEIIKGINGCYRRHGNRWDELPEWDYWDAYIVKVWVEGILLWGPFKYRKNAKKTHTGISQVEFSFGRIFDDIRDREEDNTADKVAAEDFAINTATDLETRGFKVELTYEEDGSSQKLGSKVVWIKDPPIDIFKKKIEGVLANIKPYQTDNL